MSESIEKIDETLRATMRNIITGGITVAPEERIALIERAIASGIYRRKWSIDTKAIDHDNHEMDFVVTTDTVDRDEERVLPRSFEKNFKVYKDNPVVLWSHDHRTPAVGKMVKHQFTDAEFSVRDRFAVDTTELATSLWKLYSEGFMKAVSVGFIPIEWSFDEDKKLPDQRGRTFLENEMLEHSFVNVGSNRGALAKAYEQEQDPLLRKVFERLIEQPSKADCGHMTLYDEKGEMFDPCPICEGENALVKRIVSDELDGSLEELFAPEIYGEFARKLPESTGEKIELIERPFPNEHACRLRDPGSFQRGSFRRMTRKHNGKEYAVIMGRLRGEDTLTDQAFRYPKSTWSVSQGRAHCRSHKGRLFEPASENEAEMDALLVKATMEQDSKTDIIEKRLFTLPGTYERDQRDISIALKDFKSQLGIRDFDFVFLVGTTSIWALCHVKEKDAFWLVDWERDDDGNVVLSNPRQTELNITMSDGEMRFHIEGNTTEGEPSEMPKTETPAETLTPSNEADDILATIQAAIAEVSGTSEPSGGT